MKLRDFGILCDQNVAPTVVDFFRDAGFDVRQIPTQRGVRISDSEILAAAHRENRVVVTHDTDFGELACLRREPAHGILFIRPGSIVPEKVIKGIQVLLQDNPELTSPFVIALTIRPKRCTIRIRRWVSEG